MTKITLPKGYIIFDISGPNGVLESDTVVEFDGSQGEVAAGLAAGGYADFIPLLSHTGVQTVTEVDAETGEAITREAEVAIAYTPERCAADPTLEEAAMVVPPVDESTLTEGSPVGEPPPESMPTGDDAMSIATGDFVSAPEGIKDLKKELEDVERELSELRDAIVD